MNIDLSNRILLSDTTPKAAAAPKAGTVSGDNAVFSKLVTQGLQKGIGGKTNGTQMKNTTMQETATGLAAMQETDVGQELELQGMQDLLTLYATQAASGNQAGVQGASPLVQATDGDSAVDAIPAVQFASSLQLANPQRFISLVGTQPGANALAGVTQAGEGQVQSVVAATGSDANAFKKTRNANLSDVKPMTGESIQVNSKAVFAGNRAVETNAASVNAVPSSDGKTDAKVTNIVEAGSQQAAVNAPQAQDVHEQNAERRHADETTQAVASPAGEQQTVQDQQSAAALKAIDIEGGVRVKEPMQSAETARSELYNQVAKAVTENLQSKGPTEFKLQLQPEDMGLIDIKLSLEGGKLTIDILAANAKTHALLAGQTDRLIQGLGLQNVQVENVQVGRDAADMGGQGQNQSGNMNGSADLFHRNRHDEFVNRDGGNAGYTEQNLAEEDEETASAAFAAQSMYRLNYAV